MTIKNFKKRIKLWSVSKLKMKFKHYYSAFDLSSNRESVLLRNFWLLDSMKAIKSELKRRGARITVQDVRSPKEFLGNAIDIQEDMIVWWRTLSTRIKEDILSTLGYRIIYAGKLYSKLPTPLKAELEHVFRMRKYLPGVSSNIRSLVGEVIDDVGANIGAALGAFAIAVAAGFGLYKLVLEPAFAGPSPEDEDNGEPNGVIPVEPMSFKPSLGRRYQIANVNEFANIRKGPRLGAGLLSDLPTIGKLGKVYVCLNRQQDSAGYWWCQVIAPKILLWLGGWIRTDKLKAV